MDATASEKAPVISVVVPVYNVERYLREALDSVLAQTYPHLEIVCVNDGSKDGSLEILQEYAGKDSRIRIIDQPNGGYGKAMNTGLDAATGDWFAILEPDDILPADAYGKLVRAAVEQKADFVKGAFDSFVDGVDMGELCKRSLPLVAGRVFQPREEQAYFAHNIATWAGLYNLDFLRRNGIRYHESPGAAYQDTGFFFLTAAYAERVYGIQDCVYRYRTSRPDSSVTSGKVSVNKEALIHENRYIRRHLEQHPEIWGKLRGAYMNRLASSMFYIFKQIKGHEARLEFLRLWQPFLKESEGLGFGGLSGKMRRRLKGIIQSPEAYLDSMEGGHALFYRRTPERREFRFFGLPVFTIERQPLSRRYKLFGIPVYSTRKGAAEN